MHAGGRWHLFFQSHPHAAAWGPPQWDHVSSADLLRWRRHPTALSPTPDGPDADGCWSGCVRVVDGVPTAFYTGVTGSTDDDRVERTCRASALDADLERWQVDPSPLLGGGPGFARDPYLWQDEDGWHLLLGVAGGVDHHRSPDALTWERTGRFWPDDRPRHLECPQLLRFPDGDVLVVSAQPALTVSYAVGRASGGRLDGLPGGPLEHGDALYAPAVAQGPDGRWLLWGWVRELAPDDRLADLGRVGALSLPFEATLEHGRLVLRPVRELTALRRPLADGPLPQQAEVEAVLGDGELHLLPSCDGSEVVVLRREPGAVVVDRTRASGRPWAVASPLRLPAPDGPVRLRVLLDGSVLVVCLDGVLAAVTRVYPASPERGRTVVHGDVTGLEQHALATAGDD